MTRTGRHHADDLLLGEWACLGILYGEPSHGFAVAARLAPDTEIGRVWSLSRPLTYRSLDQLARRALIEPVAQEPGIAGGTRTILTATRRGRSEFRRWCHTPVPHLRDLRSELLLKIVLAERHDIDITDTLEAQRQQIVDFLDTLDLADATVDDVGGGDLHGGDVGGGDLHGGDVVQLWRREVASAAIRFLDRWISGGGHSPPDRRGAPAERRR